MRAFKFRSLKDLDRVLDMIRSNDVWCAEWRKLNDPMEGLYYYEPGAVRRNDQRIVSAIRSGKLGRFVCALSGRFDKAALWAYYADEFRGVALEYDLSGYLGDGVIVGPVNYRSGDDSFDIHQNADPQYLADMILMSKIDDWRHEEEIRILSHRKGRLRVPGGVRSVTLGHRMAPEVKEVVHAYCERREVPVFVVELDGLRVTRKEFDPAEQTAKRRRR